MKTKFFISIAISLFFISCSSLFTPRPTFQETYQSQVNEMRSDWLGRDVQEVYRHSYWGAPDRKTYDNNGGYLLTYERKRTVPNIYSEYGSYVSYTDITTFYINSSGKVYDLKARRVYHHF